MRRGWARTSLSRVRKNKASALDHSATATHPCHAWAFNNVRHHCRITFICQQDYTHNSDDASRSAAFTMMRTNYCSILSIISVFLYKAAPNPTKLCALTPLRQPKLTSWRQLMVGLHILLVIIANATKTIRERPKRNVLKTSRLLI